MVNVINMLTDDGGFSFDIEQNGWCRLFLIKRKKRTPLGADSFTVLRNRFIYIMSHINELVMTDDIDGYSVAWAFNLNEEHSSVYVHRGDKGLVFYLQDLNAHIMDTLFVAYDECDQWVKLLNRY